ncbi:MAG: hypothetical protein WBP79_14095 [Candidatus Acidiferrales bacterium]
MARLAARKELIRVRLPESVTERLPFLETLEDAWDPVPRAALVAWLVFYVLFLYQAARGQGMLLMIDLVFIPIHEGGHLLFRIFGEFVSVAGGTLLQFFVPAALAISFAFRRQVQGVAFCAFFFFEQCLPTAPYMADARAQVMPLLTVGDADYVIHDWNYLFGHLGVLDHDIQIAGTVRLIGWLGMLGVVAWFVWRSLHEKPNATTDERR